VCIGTMLIPPLALVGCGEASRETQASRDAALARSLAAKASVDQGIKLTVAQATSNLDALGGALETTGRVPEGRAVQLQATVIDDALGITPLEKPMAKVSQAEWENIKGDLSKAQLALTGMRDAAKQAKDVLDSVKSESAARLADADRWQAQYAAEIKASRNQKIWAGLTGVAGVALWAARALNVPGISLLSDPLIRLIAGPVLKPIEAKAAEATTAATVVMSSDIGRAALGKLDQYLSANNLDVHKVIQNAVSKATGGAATSIEGLFKTVAKGVAVDQEKGAEAADYLTALRSKDIDTHLGVPTVLNGLFTLA